MQWHGVRIAVVLLATTAVVAGCGGTTRSATTTAALRQPTAPEASTQKTAQTRPATPSQAIDGTRARRAYLAAVEPVNAARRATGAKERTWTSSTTATQAAADVTQYQEALTALRPELLAVARAYPPAVAEVKELIRACEPLHGDLVGLKSLKSFSASIWVPRTDVDASLATAVARSVRTELGLPQPVGEHDL